jgi:tetratricopeptide (TPR) repeat protein
MRHRKARFSVTLVLAAGLALALPALSQFREYYFHGKVLDTQKRPLEGVEIDLRDVATSRSYSVKTNKNGEFRLAGLPHGTYKVVFKKDGYATKEDEWKFEKPQEKMQKTEIPDVVLVSAAQVRQQEELKEAQGKVKEATEKIRQQDFDGAIAILKDTLQKSPSDINALYLLGVAYSKKKMYPEAIDALTQVTKASPNFAPAAFELAICYQQQHDLDKALEFYRKTSELDPGNPDAVYNSGLILFGQNRVPEALAFFEKALALSPADPVYLEMAGRCYINQADFPKAIEYLEKAKAGYKDPERIEFIDGLIAKLKEQIK